MSFSLLQLEKSSIGISIPQTYSFKIYNRIWTIIHICLRLRLADSWADAAKAVSALRPSSVENRLVEWKRCEPKAGVPFLDSWLFFLFFKIFK